MEIDFSLWTLLLEYIHSNAKTFFTSDDNQFHVWEYSGLKLEIKYNPDSLSSSRPHILSRRVSTKNWSISESDLPLFLGKENTDEILNLIKITQIHSV